MILDKEVEVEVSGNKQSYYEDLGYTIPREKDARGRLRVPIGTKIKVRVEDLTSGSNHRIKYQCDSCGKIVESYAHRVLNKEKHYCRSCASSKANKGENNHFFVHGNRQYSQYISNANARGIYMGLTEEQFAGITSKPCHYCGTTEAIGIDRKDSSKGYTIENSVPCCSRCNFIKNNIPYQEFLDHVSQLYKHLQSKGEL